MFSILKIYYEAVVKSMYKSLTILIFSLLPSRATNAFIYFTILSVMSKLRNEPIDDNTLCHKKIESLFNISFSNKVMVFPSYTADWFWTDDCLNNTITINSVEYTIRDIIKDEQLFNDHISRLKYVVDNFTNSIPYFFKVKLGLSDRKNEIIFKHNLTSLLKTTE